MNASGRRRGLVGVAGGYASNYTDPQAEERLQVIVGLPNLFLALAKAAG